MTKDDGANTVAAAGGSPRGKTDWDALRRKSNEEVVAAALNDPDALPITKADEKGLETAPDARRIRKTLGMSQTQFAEAFDLNVSVLRDWEQLRCIPDKAARSYLRVILYEPEATMRAIASARAGSPPQIGSTLAEGDDG